MQNPVSNIAPELLKGPPEQQLVEFRKHAVEQGIPLAQIDRYLLEQDWVSVAVKHLIKESLDSAAVSAGTEPGQIEVQAGTEGQTGPEGKTGEQGVVVQPEGIQGTVKIEGVLDAKKQMERIKEEVGTVGIAEQQKDETQDQGGQTAEQKEQTTTDATQDTASGVAQRLAMSIQGYLPSKTVILNATQLAAQGDVKEAKTWQGSLVQRLQEMWGSLKGLVSVQEISG